MSWAGRPPRSLRLAWALALVAIAACAQSTVVVVALNGDEPQAGALVVAQRPDGSIIDQVHADAAGRATPRAEDDSLVTVIYPPDEVGTRIYTVAVAGLTGDLVIHAPPARPSYSTVGRLDVTATPNADADDYLVRLECAGAETKSWPVSIDFDATCIGDDGRIPVIITATTGQQPVAYAAGMATVQDGVASFAASTWSPVTPNVPIQSSDPSEQFGVTWWIDGLPFFAPVSADGALKWDGPPVGRATIDAARGDPNGAAQSTTRDQAGAPAAIVFSDGDFLPPVSSTLSITGLPTMGGTGQPLHISWMRPDVTADVLALFLGYLTKADQQLVIWTVVLSPDATEFTTPRFEGAFGSFAPRDDPGPVLQWIDSPELVGFDAARAAGIYSLPRDEAGTIVPPVSPGELRTSSLR